MLPHMLLYIGEIVGWSNQEYSHSDWAVESTTCSPRDLGPHCMQWLKSGIKGILGVEKCVSPIHEIKSEVGIAGPGVDGHRLLALDQAHFLLWFMDWANPHCSSLFFPFMVYLRGFVKASGVTRWKASRTCLQGAESFCNLPVTWGRLLYSWNHMWQAGMNLSWWKYFFRVTSKSQQVDLWFNCKLIYKWGLWYFYFPLQTLLICLSNQYSEICLKAKRHWKMRLITFT